MFSNLGQSQPAVKAGPSKVCAERGRLGYRFDPIPRALRDDVRPGRLAPIDLLVIAELLSWAIPRRDSAWCAKATIAKAIGRCPRTVQASLARLKRCGWIDHVRLDGPDPHDPRNRTGWRFWFTWMPGRGAPPRNRPGERNPSPPAESSPLLPKGDVIVGKERLLDPGGDRRSNLRSRQDPPSRSLADSATPDPDWTLRVDRSEVHKGRGTEPAAEKVRWTHASADPPPEPGVAGVSTARLAAFRSALPADLRAKLDALADGALRRRIVAGVERGADAVALSELRSWRPTAPAEVVPETTGELLARVRGQASWPLLAARALAVELDDGGGRFWPGLWASVVDAFEGRLEPADLVDAYLQATGPKAKNGGAVYFTAIGRAREARGRSQGV